MKPVEAQLQGTGGLSGPDGLHKGHRQIGSVVLKAQGQRVAAGHVLGHLQEHLAQLRRPGLLRHHLHTPDDGHTGIEDDGELGAHNGQVLVLDSGGPKGGIQVLLFLDFLDMGNDRKFFPELAYSLVFVVGLDNAGDLLPIRGQALVFEGGHGFISLSLNLPLGEGAAPAADEGRDWVGICTAPLPSGLRPATLSQERVFVS